MDNVTTHHQLRPKGAQTCYWFLWEGESGEKSILYRYRPAGSIVRDGKKHLPCAAFPIGGRF
jgi:hypothetical protein